ncbi:lipopolysaccharide assembly protein LapA domain-containing protein [Sphingobium phenoxybenzoativorans]|uniref:lipopolysaccharide assembly protein LapA domain-containing protein n=1 Tax=Sphingobium phenoxybenzoativorans TaxID=1592790 RepID=UPI000871E191|nr:lipopolysaccharide assembly protein LapA domain-containing protein [Sphingobium phenoxybenzoativorans]
MQFLRTALWVVLAVALALFCKANWVSVSVKLWGDMVADTRLPVLVVGAFLLGAVPFWIMARATRWRMKRRLDATERALASATAAAAPPPQTGMSLSNSTDPLLDKSPLTPASEA